MCGGGSGKHQRGGVLTTWHVQLQVDQGCCTLPLPFRKPYWLEENKLSLVPFSIGRMWSKVLLGYLFELLPLDLFKEGSLSEPGAQQPA